MLYTIQVTIFKSENEEWVDFKKIEKVVKIRMKRIRLLRSTSNLIVC